MADFNPLNFIADHAGMNLVDAIKEAYEQGKRDAQPKTGTWIHCGWAIACSECNYDMPWAVRNYCPSCGAKMEGEEHESC